MSFTTSVTGRYYSDGSPWMNRCLVHKQQIQNRSWKWRRQCSPQLNAPTTRSKMNNSILSSHSTDLQLHSLRPLHRHVVYGARTGNPSRCDGTRIHKVRYERNVLLPRSDSSIILHRSLLLSCMTDIAADKTTLRAAE